MILPAALSGIFLFLMNWCLCVLRTLLLVAPSLTWTVVGGRRFWPSVAVVDGRRFRPTSGHLEVISVSSYDWYSNNPRTTGRRVECVEQPSELIGRGAESVVECKPDFLRVSMDAAV